VAAVTLILGVAAATLIPGVAAVTLILGVAAATLIPRVGAIIQAQAGAQVARNLETTFQADTREFVSIKHSEIS
jgi:Na+/phosphate symporter